MIAFVLISIILALKSCNAMNHILENAKGMALVHLEIISILSLNKASTLPSEPLFLIPLISEKECVVLCYCKLRIFLIQVYYLKGVKYIGFFCSVTSKGMMKEVLYMHTANLLIYSSKQAGPL